MLEFALVRIELEGHFPPIWRHVLVSPFAKLGGLHKVIAAAIGWNEKLPHRFVLCGDIYDRIEPGEALDAKRERNWRLDSAGYRDHFFFYECGLNYEWRHRIVVEDYVYAREQWRYPRCIDGGGECSAGDGGKPFSVSSANRRIWRAVPKR